MTDDTRVTRKVLPEVVLIGVILLVDGIGNAILVAANLRAVFDAPGRLPMAYYDTHALFGVLVHCGEIAMGIGLLTREVWARRGAIWVCGGRVLYDTIFLLVPPLLLGHAVGRYVVTHLSTLGLILASTLYALVLESTRVRGAWHDGTPRWPFTLWARGLLRFWQRHGAPPVLLVISAVMVIWSFPMLSNFIQESLHWHGVRDRLLLIEVMGIDLPIFFGLFIGAAALRWNTRWSRILAVMALMANAALDILRALGKIWGALHTSGFSSHTVASVMSGVLGLLIGLIVTVAMIVLLDRAGARATPPLSA